MEKHSIVLKAAYAALRAGRTHTTTMALFHRWRTPFVVAGHVPKSVSETGLSPAGDSLTTTVQTGIWARPACGPTGCSMGVFPRTPQFSLLA